ncbi:MAG: NAD(P)-dependent oxidoreductase [Acidimicrobiales bacterium]
MRVGFIGLGNVGAKLATTLVRNGVELSVIDLDPHRVHELVALGAAEASSGAAMARDVDVIITCLPSPAASAAVMEDADGVLAALGPGQIWAEMSTTDHHEIQRLAVLVSAAGASAVDCPVSGGCHRAASGNISIFAGADRPTFERMLPLLSTMGRRVLHTGPVGSASILKVVTNYLATANLVSLCEALVTAEHAGMDLATTYEAIRISSGNSFVHETEGQVILNGSRDINFTMDLVAKDVGLFQAIADDMTLPLEVSPLLLEIFRDGIERYGSRERSPNIIRRLEDATGAAVRAEGFPAAMVDDEAEVVGSEVTPANRSINWEQHD